MIRKVSILYLYLSLTIIAFGNIGDIFVPGAPIKRFRIPVFGDQGERKYYFEGAEGVFLNEQQLHINHILMKLFEDKEPYREESQLTSPEAMVLINAKEVYSEKIFKLTSARFTLTGKSWHWYGKLNKMIINKDVNLTLNTSIGHLLE